MCTYKAFIDGTTALKTAPGLVIGFYTNITASENSIYYAVHNDGRVKKAVAPTRTNDFDCAGRLWEDTDTVPDYAGFIGHYAPTMFA